MVGDPAEATRILSGWSREVELTIDGTTKWACVTPGGVGPCGSTVMVTAGRADRVRCQKCKTLFLVEL